MEDKYLRELWKLSFDDPESVIGDFFNTAFSPRRCCTLQRGQTTAAVLYWLDVSCREERYAYLYGVATHPEFRNRGLCRELMRKTHALLRQQGYAGAILVPGGEALREMYGKMGYRTVTTLSRVSCRAGDKAVPLRTVSLEEYAALRRRYLPEGGVIQEEENLRYLQTYAQLLAGEDFLLAGYATETDFWGLELLGDPTQAPFILKALGYPAGTFRTPGEELPFAMLHPLREGAPIPAYFGLAFDE